MSSEPARRFMVTKAECEARIGGVCPGCGGPITAIETVDNSDQPTHWRGCEHCCVFTEGCPPEIHLVALQLVTEGTLVPYSHLLDRHDSYGIRTQTAAAAAIVRRVQALLTDAAREEAGSTELATLRTRLTEVQSLAEQATRLASERADEVGRLTQTVETLRPFLAEVRQQRDSISYERDVAVVELDRARPVVEAAKAWLARGGGGQSSNLWSPTQAEDELEEAITAYTQREGKDA